MSDALLGQQVQDANGNWSRPNAGTAYASAWNPSGGGSNPLDGTGKLLAGILSGMAAGTAAAAMRGGKFSVQQVATDAFGNAIGNSVVDNARNSGSGSQQSSALNDAYALATGAGSPGLRLGGGAGLSFGGIRATATDSAASNLNDVNGLDLASDTYNGSRGAATVAAGQGPLAAYMAAGLNAQQAKLAYGQALASGQIALNANGVPIVQPGQTLYYDMADASQTGLGARVIAMESRNREVMLAAAYPAGAGSPLPSGWSMRDAFAASTARAQYLRGLDSPSVTATSGYSVSDRLAATARTIDSIAANPFGAAGYLFGKAAGADERDAAMLAAAAAATGDLLTLRAGVSRTYASAAEEAASWQGSPRFPSVDRWRPITLRAGTIIYAGEPGLSGFMTTESAIRKANNDAAVLFGGLQVPPRNGLYRNGVTAFEVLEDIPAAMSRALGKVCITPQNGWGCSRFHLMANMACSTVFSG
jgi:hypothetical protein